MKRLLSAITLLAMGTLTACSSYVAMNATAFYETDFPTTGKMVVVHADPEINGSLEFAHYREKIEAKFTAAGFQIVGSPDDADMAAIMSYGIDNGKTTVKSTPVTGFYMSTGMVRGRSGVYYSMPMYTSMGSNTTVITEYKRALAMDIVDAHSLREGNPKRLYESRVISEGECTEVNKVFDVLLDGMFDNFPGEAGVTQKLDVPGDDSC